MRKIKRNEVIAKKTFYRDNYRRGLKMLFFSLLVTLFLLGSIFYKIDNSPEPDFYATNGISAPLRLKALEQPNEQSRFLLEPDPSDDMKINKEDLNNF